MHLARGALGDPSEAEYLAHVISLLLLLALEHGEDCREDGELRAVQLTGQDIGKCAELLDIGEQVDGNDLREGSEDGALLFVGGGAISTRRGVRQHPLTRGSWRNALRPPATEPARPSGLRRCSVLMFP